MEATGDSVVDRLYSEHLALIEFLSNQGELSLANSADAEFRKVLLLSSASLFEHQVRVLLLEYLEEKMSGDELAMAFVRTKAVERQYHTYFEWRDRRANKFFSLFGTKFKDYMVARVKDDDALDQSVAAFLELGELRNKVVHENYGEFAVDKTAAEIYSLYCLAKRFIAYLPLALRNWRQ